MINKMKYVLLILIISASFIYAQNEIVLDIEIEGNQNVEAELVRSISTIRIGERLTGDNVASTIHDLYQLGVFEDVKITKQTLDRGVIVTIHVTEFPIIESVTYSGNSRIKDSRLREISRLRRGSYWSPFLKNEAKREIISEYESKGHHLAEIEFIVTELEDNRVELTLEIEEGDRVVVKNIRIHGNKEVPNSRILRIMKTKRSSLFRSGKFEEEQFEEDLEAIIDYYNKEGFIDARIISTEREIIDGRFVIDIYLQEGNRYYFGDIIVSGNTRFADHVIRDKFIFEDDEIFDLEKFNRQVNSVASMYYDEGYIYAQFDHELERVVDRINVRFNISENNRAKVRKIHIRGNRRTKEKVIRRNLAIYPGDYFRQSLAIRTQQNIYNLGFFEPDIRLDYRPINRNGDIDLIIDVNDRISGSAQGGVAINSHDGLIGQLAVTHNNLFGNAWQAGVKWEFGGKTQNFSFNFTNPYTMDTNILTGFDVYHTTREWNTFELRTRGGALRVGQPVPFLNHARIVGGYSYYSKRYRILEGIPEEDVSENLKDLDKRGWQNTSALSLTFTRDSRDNVFFPTAGSQIMFYNQLAGGFLQGDFDYFKQIVQMSWYTKTFWEFVLGTKWRFGYVTGYGGSEVPPDERFYLGGTGPDGIRGYGERSVGPRDGGLRQVIFSTEYSWPIASDQIIGLAFFDAGNSFNHLTKFNFWDMKIGSGLGIRIRSPFGLIGFDYAYSFENRSWEPHFQFGTTF